VPIWDPLSLLHEEPPRLKAGAQQLPILRGKGNFFRFRVRGPGYRAIAHRRALILPVDENGRRPRSGQSAPWLSSIDGQRLPIRGWGAERIGS